MRDLLKFGRPLPAVEVTIDNQSVGMKSEINMTTIAIYLFFVGGLSGYRASRYWPKELTTLSWLKKGWWSWGCVLLGAVLLGIDRGWTTGLLLALCIYMMLLSCVVFFTNCNRGVRSVAVILFHTLCMLGVIFKF